MRFDPKRTLQMVTVKVSSYKDFAGSEPCVFAPRFVSSDKESTMTAADQLPLAARIGLDWADGHHDLALRPAGSDRIERVRIAHTPEAL